MSGKLYKKSFNFCLTLLCFLSLCSLNGCSQNEKDISYKITFQEETALYNAFEDLEFSKDFSDVNTHGFFDNKFYFSKWSNDGTMISQTEKIWRYDFDTKEYSEVLSLEPHIRVQDIVEIDGVILYSAVQSGNIDYLTPYTVSVHEVKDGKDSILIDGLTWNYMGTPGFYQTNDGIYFNLFTMDEENNDYSSYKEHFNVCIYKNNQLSVIDSGSYDVVNWNMELNEGQRFLPSIGSMANNSQSVYYTVLNKNKPELRFGREKIKSYPLSIFPNGALGVTDKYIITSATTEKNATYRIKDMKELHFSELDGLLNGDLFALENGIIIKSTYDSNAFYHLNNDQLVPIEVTIPENSKFHFMNDGNNLIAYSLLEHRYYRVNIETS